MKGRHLKIIEILYYRDAYNSIKPSREIKDGINARYGECYSTILTDIN
jgi:hypothetical protein